MKIYERFLSMVKDNVRLNGELPNLNFELSLVEDGCFNVSRKVTVVKTVIDKSNQISIDEVKIFGNDFFEGESIDIDETDYFPSKWINETYLILESEFGKEVVDQLYSEYKLQYIPENKSIKTGPMEDPDIDYEEFVKRIQFIYKQDSWINYSLSGNMGWSQAYVVTDDINREDSDKIDYVYIFKLKDSLAKLCIGVYGGEEISNIDIFKVESIETKIIEYKNISESVSLL